jgi:hypothetical protein
MVIATISQLNKIAKLLSFKQQKRYSQVSPVAVNYFGEDTTLTKKRRFRDHYYLDEGRISIITNIEEEEYTGVDYHETSLHDYVEFLNRLEQNNHVLKITRENFTKIIPRFIPLDTPYPTDIPFTYQDVVSYYHGISDKPSLSQTNRDWSMLLEYDSENNNYYIYTLYQDYLHGSTYIIEFNEPKYLGSYNYGYKDGIWIQGKNKVVYSKGTITSDENDNGDTLISSAPGLAPGIENSSLLLYVPGKQTPPHIINDIIVTETVDYY